GDQHDVATAAAVAAIRPTPWLVLLAVERGHAVAAAPGGHLDGGLVDEHGALSGSGPGRAGLGARVDAGQLAAAHHVVHDMAVDLGEQGVAAAAADAGAGGAGGDAGAALSAQDRARGHPLAAVTLAPEPLGGRVAAVAAGGRALLVGHLSLPLPACPSAPAWPCRRTGPRA